MNKIKVIHCADLHLGAELSSLGHLARVRREEHIMTFTRIIDLCRNEKVDLLLIAGDLFEGSCTDQPIVDAVREAFARIPDTLVAIAPGNHDFIALDSPYERERWPDNVVLFKTGYESAEFADRGFCLWGAGFTRTYAAESMMPSGADAENALINIGVLHGDLVAAGQASPYNPVTVSQISGSGLDYLALGHVHKRTDILQSGRTYYAYSGCPEGRGFDELDEKGVYIGSVSKGKADMAFLPVCRRMNLELPVDISPASTQSEAAEIIRRTAEERYGEQYQEHLYKIILTGALTERFVPDCLAIAIRLQDCFFYIKVYDQTHPAIDVAALAKEISLKGIYTRKMLEQIDRCFASGQETAAGQYQRALYLGLRAFDQEVNLNEDQNY